MLVDNLLTTKNAQPIELKSGAAIASLLMRLILLVPGENQSHPDMGVGIVSQHRYNFAEDVPILQNIITEQIATYLPMLSDVKVELGYSDSILNISIETTSMILKFEVKDSMLSLNDIIANK